MCHCEPFAFCHSDPVSSTGEESHYFAQDKLREAISRDCRACVPKRLPAAKDFGRRGFAQAALRRAGTSLGPVHHAVQGFAPRNDCFSGSFTIIKVQR